MRSYRNYSTIDIKEKEAAKEKNKRTGTKSFFSLLAAKFNQKLLRGRPDASRDGFLEKSPPGRRRQKSIFLAEMME